MLDACKSNPKLIKQPYFKVLDTKGKSDSKKIDGAYAELMKKMGHKKIYDVYYKVIKNMNRNTKSSETDQKKIDNLLKNWKMMR